MPVAYIIDKKRKLVVTTARGAVTYREVIDVLAQLKRDPGFVPTYGHVVDHTEAAEFARTVQEVELLAKWHVFSPSSQWAFVAPSYVAVELAQEFNSHQRVPGAPKALAFRDKETALRWLGFVEHSDRGNPVAGEGTGGS